MVREGAGVDARCLLCVRLILLWSTEGLMFMLSGRLWVLEGADVWVKW